MRTNTQPASRNERIRWITSPSCRTAMGRPQRRKTFSMGRLRESTSASSRSRPFTGDGDDMTHQQAADPAALEVLFDGEGQFGAAPRGGDGAADEMARPADDDLVLARADGYQQRDRPLEICPRDPTEFGVTDIGLITKEPRVDCVPLEIEEGAADLRSVIGTGRAYRHRGAVPERLCEDIARVLHASPSRPDDPCPTFCR